MCIFSQFSTYSKKEKLSSISSPDLEQKKTTFTMMVIGDQFARLLLEKRLILLYECTFDAVEPIAKSQYF